jgi:hypothetical protein
MDLLKLSPPALWVARDSSFFAKEFLLNEKENKTKNLNA